MIHKDGFGPNNQGEQYRPESSVDRLEAHPDIICLIKQFMSQGGHKRPYTRLHNIQASATTKHTEYSDPLDIPGGVHVESATFVDVTSAIATSVVFGIEHGGQLVPLATSGAIAAGVPVPITAPFNLMFGQRLYAVADSYTAADQCYIFVSGFEL